MFKKLNNKKGFTLMEMLIVVAIIAILVAIAIPVMVNALEKAREATDLANARSAYAQIMATALTDGDKPADTNLVTYTRTGDKAGQYTYTAVITMTQAVDDWATTGGANLVAGVAATGSVKGGGTCTITFVQQTAAVTIVYA